MRVAVTLRGKSREVQTWDVDAVFARDGFLTLETRAADGLHVDVTLIPADRVEEVRYVRPVKTLAPLAVGTDPVTTAGRPVPSSVAGLIGPAVRRTLGPGERERCLRCGKTVQHDPAFGALVTVEDRNLTCQGGRAHTIGGE